MSPIRIGFIGLSSSQSWSTWAHLPYLKSSSKYEIVALCNSTLEKAQAAIRAHELPSSTKAYGEPAELAGDQDVDLIVCAVRVDKHYETILPALKAGKDVYCEWPLAKSLKEAEALEDLRKDKNLRTMVGLQSIQAPYLRKIKKVIGDGQIGKVLSSTFSGNPGFFGLTEAEYLAYCNDIEIGANMVTIYSMHSLEAILCVLDELESFNSIIEVKRPEIQLLDHSGQVVGTTQRTAHDQVLIQGHTKAGTLLSYHLHGGAGFDGKEGLNWTIYGEKGEIKVSGPNSYLHIGDESLSIAVHDHGSGRVEDIVIDTDVFDTLPLFSRNVARIYEAFADKRQGEYREWDHAVLRHKMVEELYERERTKEQDQEAKYVK
ncbi:NAD-binding Rossmann fold oxidoreductase family protein [Patellaria atrata CBS 101060]|uniref:NAD-binding Rossmann fold oxidoreductase family protein n=1 Tax=Patellaria atrata CBS 101060 TaxID=1346257 RepID=A0A9P4VLL7_9PEZI|nr:NAD-binding Rossmann fold oxidoreductase family protein [Patellaria atrata CBS 101060]